MEIKEELLSKCPYCKRLHRNAKIHIQQVHPKELQKDLDMLIKNKNLKPREKQIIKLFVKLKNVK